MLHRLSWLIAALAGWLLPAAAQQEASATLYARPTALGVEVAVEVELNPTWHLFHTELGAPDAIGQISALELSGIGVEFGEQVWPKPHRTNQEWGMNGGPTWAWTHEGTFTVYAFGAWDGEAEGDVPPIFATLTGQTCSDLTGTCIPYEEELEVAGPGAEALFADFPDALRPEVPVAAPEPDAAKPFATGDMGKLFAPGGGGQGFGAPGFGAAQGIGGRIDVSARHRITDTSVELLLHVEVDPTWHLFHTELGAPDAIGKPASIALQPAGLDWRAPVFPEPHRTEQEWGLNNGPTWAWTHEGAFDVFIEAPRGEGDLPVDVTGTLTGQVCSDVTGECIAVDLAFTSGLATDAAPFDAYFASRGAGGLTDGSSKGATKGAGSNEGAGTVNATLEPDPEPASTPSEDAGSLWGLILAGIGAGLFTLLMPCTYPMIPITVSFFTKQAEKSGKPPLTLSLAYGLGIVLIFEVIALVVGPLIIPFAQHYVTNLIIGAVFLYFAFVLLGIVNLNPPAALMNLAGTASQKGGFVGVFLMGATLVVTSFTCTAPIVGSLLTAGASGGSTLEIVVGMAAFGVTMAIPFVVLSLVPGKLSDIPSAGEWMNTLKVTLGFVELAAAFKFFSNADVWLQTGLLPDELLLLVWVVILLVAGLYLLGQVKLTTSGSDRITPIRSLFGMATLGLVGYLLMVLLGYPRGELMTAFLPGYSNGSLAIGSAEGAPSHDDGPITIGDAGQELHIDSYATARDAAIAQGKLLLVNLTGFT